MLVNNSEDVALIQDGVGCAINYDFSTTVFGDEHLIIDSHVERNFFAVLIATTGADSAHDSFLGFFLSCIRQEEPTRSLALSFYSFDEYALS